MMNTQPIAGRAQRMPLLRRGLSLVEVLISLAISASLLTAIAAAFSASASAIEMNDEVFRATQSARVTMLHLLTEIRQGTVGETSTATELKLITSGSGSVVGDNRTYRFTGAPDDKLMLITEDDTTDLDYPLASNVLASDPASDSRFDYRLGADSAGNPLVLQVTVTIVTRVGKNTIRLSGTASPREFIDH
jgi:prepilin-type N-terminal cleavage/methylation domain-containing protein